MKKPKLVSLDHVTIIVSDLEKTRRFYVDLIGMTEVARPSFEFEGAWFAVDSTAHRADIHATLASDLAGRAGWGELGAKSISRGHHFAFQVQDATLMEAELVEQGVEIAVPCQLRPDGPTQFYVHDPDGHVVELFSF